jgi:hypothetical protein
MAPRLVGTNVRVARICPLYASQDTLSGNLFTSSWILIPRTNTWTNLWTWATAGLNPSLEAKAYVTGTKTFLELRWTGSFAGLSTDWYATGQIYSQQYTTPTAP